MKRYLILGLICGALLLLLLLLPHRGGNGGTQPAPEAVPGTPVATSPPPNEPGIGLGPEYTPEESNMMSAIRGTEQQRTVRSFNETANTPVAFYAQVVDQDTNPLQNVQVGVMVSEEYMRPTFESRIGPTTNLQRRTGPDGRFEVTGLKGHRVSITGLAKDGYEPELGISELYGIYDAQSGSFTEPVVFRMWSTNIQHEKLIIGKNGSAIIPDGRRYCVNLTNGAIAEGSVGDLVVWIRRPASVGSNEKYGWSCEMAASGEGGLLEESRDPTMFRAPTTGYTNVFAYQEEAGVDGWLGALYGRRFYVRLRDGRTYGRITFNFDSTPSRYGQAQVWLEYTINPSGSRLLR
jgi:hypothetical protein